MKKIFLLLAFGLVACKSTQTQISNYQVSQQEISSTLAYLSSDELEGRDTGSEGIEKAAVYLENQLKKYNYKPYFRNFRDTLTTIDNAYNVVGFLEGKDPKLKNEIVILSAHYDHIGITEKGFEGDNINNGANDNASGTTVLSEVAKYLGELNNNQRSVLIVYFSAEEKGLLGAKHLAKRLKYQNVDIYTLLNFEMLGVPMNYNFDVFLTGFTQSNMADKLNEYAGYELVGKSEQAEKYNLFRASDNYPFYEEFKIPSHTISAFDFGNFDFYHHPKDEFQMMNIEFMTQLTQKLLPVVSEMINAPTREIQMN